MNQIRVGSVPALVMVAAQTPAFKLAIANDADASCVTVTTVAAPLPHVAGSNASAYVPPAGAIVNVAVEPSAPNGNVHWPKFGSVGEAESMAILVANGMLATGAAVGARVGAAVGAAVGTAVGTAVAVAADVGAGDTVASGVTLTVAAGDGLAMPSVPDDPEPGAAGSGATVCPPELQAVASAMTQTAMSGETLRARRRSGGMCILQLV